MFEKFNKRNQMPYDRETESLARKEWVSTLEKTPGYRNMNPKQRQYILTALAVSQRAERGTDVASNTNLIEPLAPMRRQAPEGRPYIYLSGDNEQPAKYLPSQLSVAANYCMDMPAKLESCAANVDENNPDRWVEAGEINNYQDLLELISLAGESGNYPFVLEISNHKKDPMTGELFSQTRHVTIILGSDENGEEVVWEKSGAHLPWQIANLHKIYDIYAGSNQWKIRPLLT